MLLIDVSQTCHTHAQTGVQRVCRGIYFALKRSGIPFKPICYDPFIRAWREIFQDELLSLELRHTHSGKWTRRGAHWSFTQRARSMALALLPSCLRPKQFNVLEKAKGLIAPEVLCAKHVGAYDKFKYIPCVAVFHDATPETLPHHTAPENIQHFATYIECLATKFSGIAPNSLHSEETLLSVLSNKKLSCKPKIKAIALGVDPIQADTSAASEKQTTTLALRKILTVGTLEGRKNHQALLEAAKILWDNGVSFELILAGGLNKKTGSHVLESIEELVKNGYPISYLGPVSEHALRTLYSQAYFTVYPSIYEGFGLPVIESVQHGKPCITGSGGALSTTAEGGGVVSLPDVSAKHLEEAMKELLGNESSYKNLVNECTKRIIKTWDDYLQELLQFMDEL